MKQKEKLKIRSFELRVRCLGEFEKGEWVVEEYVGVVGTRKTYELRGTFPDKYSAWDFAKTIEEGK